MCQCGKNHEPIVKQSLKTLFKQRDALQVLVDTDYVPSGRTLKQGLETINAVIEDQVSNLS